ncbi:hypothetical protein [Sulfurivermis fontis]|uniref:hypothetical protein n=1 Tax=Sulfurivermis fontis TaxID=1972068 RepID=UPI0015592701|nr:hypothetical protein [Sulfurivermis fontis]
MGQKVAVATAVRLLGIKRSELQHLIHDGELPAPEGMVDVDLLRQLYPRLALQESPVLERVQLIKTTAFSRRVRSTLTPDRDDLEIQLRKRNAELSLERAMAKKYREIIDQLCRKLDAMQDCSDDVQRRVVQDINRWLLEQLEK